MRILSILLVITILSGCSSKPDQALGTLEWDRVNGRAVVSETIVEMFAKEGQRVEKGQPLLKLDCRLQEAQVNRAEGNVRKAEWKLSQLQKGYREEEVAAAKADLEAAVVDRKTRKLEYERQQDVFKKGLTSQKTVDDAKNQYSQSIGKEKSARENLNKLLTGYREEEVEQAKAELAAAESELAYQRELLDHYTVTAKRSGVLDSLPFKLGDKPPAGAVVSTVLAGEAPWARVYIPETWLSSVQVGQNVHVRIDGIEQPMTGTIRHIESDAAYTPYYALAEQNRKRLSFVSQIDLVDEQAKSLPVGLPVQVELIDD